MANSRGNRPAAVTLRDVAAATGVSIKTVSNVVNGHQHISDETRSRVSRAIADLGYRPNLSARALRTGSPGVLQLTLPALDRDPYSSIADAFLRATARNEFDVRVNLSSETTHRTADLAPSPHPQLADGSLIVVTTGAPELRVAEMPAPTVLLVVVDDRFKDGRNDLPPRAAGELTRRALQRLLELVRLRDEMAPYRAEVALLPVVMMAIGEIVT